MSREHPGIRTQRAGRTAASPLKTRQGAIFTPPPLARRLVEPLLAEIGPETPVLDPACGDGALLLAAFEELGARPEAADRLFGIEIEPEIADRARLRLEEAGAGPREGLDGRIAVADALDPAVEWPAGAAIVANPPWVSFSGRQAGHGSLETRRGSRPGGWPSLQGAFLERIALHCARYAVPARLLLPASMLELEGYAALRTRVELLVHPSQPPEELGENAFPGVIEPAVILSLSPGPAAGGAGWGSSGAPDRDILNRLEPWPKLPPKTFADPGMHSGNAGAEIVSAAPQPGWAPLRRGADLAAYDLAGASRWLRLDLTSSPEQYFRIAKLDHYRSFPVLLRQTADRPIAALHVDPTFFRNSLLAARAVPDLDPAFLVGLLNSPPATLWHRARFRDSRQRTFPQVKVGHLRTQPTPITRRAEDPVLHDEVANAVRRLVPGSVGFAGEVRWIERRIGRAFGLPA